VDIGLNIRLRSIHPFVIKDKNQRTDNEQQWSIIIHGPRRTGTRPGNSAILLETGSCAIILTRVDSPSRDASRALRRLCNIYEDCRRDCAILLTR